MIFTICILKFAINLWAALFLWIGGSAGKLPKLESLKPKNIFFVYFIVLILLAIAPLNGSSHSLNDVFILKLRSDYIVHALQFVPWIYFGIKLEKKFLYWLLFGFLIASVTEGVQYFLIYRTFNINDLMANLIGVVAGSFSLLFVLKRAQS